MSFSKNDAKKGALHPHARFGYIFGLINYNIIFEKVLNINAF